MLVGCGEDQYRASGIGAKDRPGSRPQARADGAGEILRSRRAHGLVAQSARPGRYGRVLLETLGRMFELGVEIDWQQFAGDDHRTKISLPTYPFQRQRCWANGSKSPVSRPFIRRRSP